MVGQNPTPSQGRQVGHGNASTSSHVLIMANDIAFITTRAKTYDIVLEQTAFGSASNQPSSSTSSPPPSSLPIEKLIFDLVLRPPKSTIQKSTFNPSFQASQHYNIVEDMA